MSHPFYPSAAVTVALIAAASACDPPPKRDGAGSATASASTTAATSPSASGTAATTATASASAAASANCPSGCFSIERCDNGRCVPACPEGEVYIPATPKEGFTMGQHARRRVDQPHNVVLTKPFCMDATEVTVAAYKACVDAQKCEPPRPWGMWMNYPKLKDHPVNKVHWHHSKAYCEQRGQSLPSEAQWEWAASGGDGRTWPWGNDAPTCKHADYTPGFQESPSGDDGCHGGGTSPVKSHPAGDREWPDGKLHDLGGNVWEWCIDNFRPWSAEAKVDPVILISEGAGHVVRGGGWNRSAEGIRTYYRGGSDVDYQVPGLGFRCVRNPAPKR